MITAKLFGRLGNQLFIIAAVSAYARRHGITFGIPKFITCPPGLPSDPIYFNHFPDPGILAEKAPEWKEPADQSYMEIPEALSGSHFCLNGYFQSYRYFEDQRKGVIDELLKTLPIIPIVFRWVSIHVRRGDYLTKPDCHPVLNVYYYNRAINFFRARGLKHFCVFSDDFPWCEEHINKDNYPDCAFIYSKNQSAMEDLQSMKSCEHHIIANSSFSWWGAYLSENKNKWVVAPKTWYGPELSHIDTKDLIPENWIRL